jgi:dimethylargininase
MKALVRPPGPRLNEGIVTHIEREPVDLDLAYAQWQAYVEALQKYGWTTVEVPSAPNCPDAVFVEDAVVVYRNVALITRPGADARKPEVVDVELAVRSLGYAINRIHPPGTLDGGDVLKVGRTVYVGQGGRTNGDGIRQLREIFEPLGATVVAVPTTKVLHLKSAVTALPDESVIGYQPLVDSPSFFPHFRAVPEESGSHVVLLGQNRLLIAADCPESAEMFAHLGYEPVPVDISEFQKLEGCVTCLSVRLRAID